MSLDTMDDSRHSFEPPELTDREVAQSSVESGEDNVSIFKDLQELEQLLAEDDIGTSDQPAAQIHDTALLEPSMQELESTLSEARATLQGSLGRTAAAERAAAAREAAKRDAAAAHAASEQREREAKARIQELAEREAEKALIQELQAFRNRAEPLLEARQLHIDGLKDDAKRSGVRHAEALAAKQSELEEAQREAHEYRIALRFEREEVKRLREVLTPSSPLLPP